MCLITYSRVELLQLQPQGKSNGIIHSIPHALRKPFGGCQAGAHVKARRWRYKPFLPSIIMGNVNSLPNKCEELEALIKTDRIYRECSLYCITEMWLTDAVPDSAVNIPGFTTVRANRQPEECGKTKGGGLVLLVIDRWCQTHRVWRRGLAIGQLNVTSQPSGSHTD